MYINSGYLRNSRIDFKDHTRPLVVGSCGAYFHIAHRVIQMDAYHARDITGQAKAVLEGRVAPALSAPGFRLPAKRGPLSYLNARAE